LAARDVVAAARTALDPILPFGNTEAFAQQTTPVPGRARIFLARSRVLAIDRPHGHSRSPAGQHAGKEA
jgi:hypothetical protein